MRLGIFVMPLHPLHRAPAVTLQEDREAIILADQLGCHDAFVGEHLTDQAENVTNSFIFLASLVHATKTIKLATGTSNLSQSHPVLIAAHATMFDHLVQGRFIFGVSFSAPASDAEALGILNEDRIKLFAEVIDVILQIWERGPPYEIDLPANRFKVTTAKTFVADDDKVAEGYGNRDAASPYRFHWRQLRIKLTIPKRHIVLKTHEGQDDTGLTDDYVVDPLVIAGTVNKVVNEILKLREQVEDFGEIVYPGMDWVDPKLAKRSMELMATDVMSRINAAIGGTAQPWTALSKA